MKLIRPQLNNLWAKSGGCEISRKLDPIGKALINECLDGNCTNPRMMEERMLNIEEILRAFIRELEAAEA